MAQRYEYQDIEGHVILLFVHPALFSYNHNITQTDSGNGRKRKRITTRAISVIIRF
jgi:hypothetical protein